MTPIGFDTETFLIGPEALAPRMVCVSAAQGSDTFLEKGDAAGEGLIAAIFDRGDRETVRVAHNLSFDLGVLTARDPRLFSAAFDLLEDGLLQCTKIREKLLNFTLFGDMEYVEMPDGTTFKVSYSLGDLIKFHFGIDISESKSAEDAWRLNYSELDPLPISEWPEDARQYAIDDSVYAAMLWKDQESRRAVVIEETGHDPFATLELQCLSDFCLHLMSIRGLEVDPDEHLRIKRMLEDELAPEKMSVLYEAGVLRPGSPPRPYANGATDPDGSPKMTAGTKDSVNTKVFQALVESACKANGIEVRYTEPSKKFPEGQISTSAEVLEEIAHLDPVLEEYQRRQSYQKLVTTELPRMEWEGEPARVVHPCYDVLKKSGRTSSYASKIFPSFNCQNVDPRVRRAFRAREGFVLFSVDYNQMELCTLGQTCLDLFGESVLARKINEGKDLHAYLGAQIAKATVDWFAEEASDDADECYEQFQAYKKVDEKWWKHYRTLAKPTGLGYPGGLGAKTFVAYAKATYGLRIDLETAEMLREVWRFTFPEMPHYFEYINKESKDPRRSSPVDGDRYHFTTPLGMYRCNANYCSAANGKGLQSPSAEGAKLGLINIVQATKDPERGSILYGDDVHNICFVHDENIGEIRLDEHTHDRAYEIARLMVAGMKVVCPDIDVRAQPVLMHKWSKDAEPVFDTNGRLIPWEDKK